MSLASGTRLGPYEIVAPIGAGGMGEVYRARDTRLSREVAVKVISPRLATDADQLRRFEQEARAVSQLDHPNILVVHDIGSHEGSPYIVSELLDGESLREKLGEPLAPKKAVDYALQATRGLAAAHEKGIVHRDLKPENLFVTRDGRVKILDFGLAKLTQPAIPSVSLTEALTASPATDTGIVMGTVGYMSPEQVMGKPLDGRSDLFSLGVVLYEMLSGKSPFQKGTAAETMAAILKEEPPELSGTNKPVPPGLDRIVRHCLEKEPSNRFQTARDLGFDLEALTSVSEGTSGATSAPPRQLRMRRLGLLGVLLALPVALGLAFLIGRRTAGTDPATFHRLTWGRGTVISARFAPDGQTVLYSASWDGGRPKIYIKRPESPDSVPLGLPSAVLLAVSPSGELAIQLNAQIANLEAYRGTLARAALTGGSPREIAEGVDQADWGPGGSLVVTRDAGVKRVLEYPLGKVLYETTGYVGSPRLSPLGDLIAFVDHPSNAADDGSIAVLDLSGKKKILSKQWGSVRWISWSPSGSEVWFTAAERGGNKSLYGVSLSGKQRFIAGAPADVHLLDVNRAGRVLLMQADERIGISYSGPGESRERDLSWLQWSIVTDISQDGSTIAMVEMGEASASSTVCLRKTDGSPVVRLGEGLAGSLSPDGKWVSSRRKLGSPIVLLPTGPGEPKEVSSQGLSTVTTWVGWSPDGKWIVVMAREGERGPARLYLLSLDGGKPRAVSGEVADSSYCFPVSPDARLVAAVGADRKISLYPVAGGEARPVPGGAEGDIPLQWSAGGNLLFVAEQSAGPYSPARVYTLEIGTGKRLLWKGLFPEDSAGVISIGRVRITPDGRSYAYGYRRLLSELYLAEGLR